MYKSLLKNFNAIYFLKSQLYCRSTFYVIHSLVEFNINCTLLLFNWFNLQVAVLCIRVVHPIHATPVMATNNAAEEESAGGVFEDHETSAVLTSGPVVSIALRELLGPRDCDSPTVKCSQCHGHMRRKFSGIIKRSVRITMLGLHLCPARSGN